MISKLSLECNIICERCVKIENICMYKLVITFYSRACTKNIILNNCSVYFECLFLSVYFPLCTTTKNEFIMNYQVIKQKQASLIQTKITTLAISRHFLYIFGGPTASHKKY